MSRFNALFFISLHTINETNPKKKYQLLCTELFRITECCYYCEGNTIYHITSPSTLNVI